MKNYWYARYTPGTSKNQSELLYLANMYVGYEEQTKLQPYIVNAFPGNISIYIPIVNETIVFNPASIITIYLISIAFPNEYLLTSEDVTVRPWDGLKWPSYLNEFDFPPLIQLYLFFVGQLNSLNGTAASNWDSLSQRMRFVVPMFRSRHNDLFLTSCPPFTMNQVQQIWSGQKPDFQSLCISNCCLFN